MATPTPKPKKHRAEGAGSRFTSRKFAFAVGLVLVLFAEAYIAGLHPAMMPSLDTIVGGQIAIFGLYSGANVTASWFQRKKGVPKPKASKKA